MKITNKEMRLVSYPEMSLDPHRNTEGEELHFETSYYCFYS